MTTDITQFAELWPIDSPAEQPKTVGELSPGDRFKIGDCGSEWLVTTDPGKFAGRKCVDTRTGETGDGRENTHVSWSSRHTTPVRRTWGDIPRLPAWGVVDGKPSLVRENQSDSSAIAIDDLPLGKKHCRKSDPIPDGTVILLPKA